MKHLKSNKKISSLIKSIIEGSYIQLLSIIALIIVWYYASSTVKGNYSVIPAINEIYLAGKDAINRGFFIDDLVMSCKRVYPGLFYGSIIGVFIGIITGRSRFLYKSFGTYFHIWRALPAVALVPVIIQFFGVSEFAKIFMIALGVFFPVWISTHEGASQLPETYKELSENLKLSKFRFNIKIVIPFSLSYSIGGLRTGIALSFIMLFVAEWIGASEGIGYRISYSHIIDKMDLMFLGLIELGLLAFLTDALFKIFVSKVFPWIKYSK